MRKRRARWVSKLMDIHDRVRELYEALAPELPDGDRARVEANLIKARRAEDSGIDEIRGAHRWLTVSLETLETAAFMALPLEQRVLLALPEGVVEDFAASRYESPEALRAVALNPEWAARQGVRCQLVMNPTTPLDVQMRLVDGLWNEDLEVVVRSDVAVFSNHSVVAAVTGDSLLVRRGKAQARIAMDSWVLEASLTLLFVSGKRVGTT